MSVHSQEVRAFILQHYQRTPPTCCWRICNTTRHTPSRSQTHTLSNTRSLIHTHKQKHMLKLSPTRTHDWIRTQIRWRRPTHTPSHAKKQTATHTRLSWCSCNRCLRSRQPTQRGMREQLWNRYLT